jgi:hypothetical protein
VRTTFTLASADALLTASTPSARADPCADVPASANDGKGALRARFQAKPVPDFAGTDAFRHAQYARQAAADARAFTGLTSRGSWSRSGNRAALCSGTYGYPACVYR